MGPDARRTFCNSVMHKLSEALQCFKSTPLEAHEDFARRIASLVRQAYGARAMASEGFVLPAAAEFQTTGDCTYERKNARRCVRRLRLVGCRAGFLR